MLDAVVNMFTRDDPKRGAALALARIMSRYDMQRLGFEKGISEDRRSRDERHIAMGVWLFPCDPMDQGQDIQIFHGVPAVTHDLRAKGFGIMTPVRLKHEHFVVAAHDDDSGWRFFRCHVRHNTRRPGGWYQLGLNVDRVLDLDSKQRVAFRLHVESVAAVSPR